MSILFNNKKYIFMRLALAIWMGVALGCSTVSSHTRAVAPSAQERKPSRRALHRSPLGSAERSRLLSQAKSALGKSQVTIGTRSFRNDCSGTIRGIFAGARIGLGGIIKNSAENDVKAIYRYVQKYGTIHKNKPEVGDLVFFHNTYDRSRDGRMRDPLTHIGIVEKVEGSTVYFIHHLGQSIIRSRMDLSRPRETFDAQGQTRLNHILRRPQGRNRAYTAAELFAGYGRL